MTNIHSVLVYVTLVVAFLIAGFTAIQTDFSWVPTVLAILSVIGGVLHTNAITTASKGR